MSLQLKCCLNFVSNKLLVSFISYFNKSDLDLTDTSPLSMKKFMVLLCRNQLLHEYPQMGFYIFGGKCGFNKLWIVIFHYIWTVLFHPRHPSLALKYKHHISVQNFSLIFTFAICVMATSTKDSKEV